MALDLNTAAAWQGEETMIIYYTASVAKSGRKQIVNGVLRLSVCVSMSVPDESVRKTAILRRSSLIFSQTTTTGTERMSSFAVKIGN